MASGPHRRFTAALFLVLLVGCGSESEPWIAEEDDIPTSPTPHRGAANAGPSCSPAVALGDPIASPLPAIACPPGWHPRERKDAVPVSRRFTTPRELVDAFCVASDADADAEPSVDVDFEANDVIAVAYDGEVALHRRAGELWIRHTERCEGGRSYRTALFVVPKAVTPREQTCSSSCL